MGSLKTGFAVQKNHIALGTVWPSLVPKQTGLKFKQGIKRNPTNYFGHTFLNFSFPAQAVYA